jgi:hypothetical protein
MDFISKAQRLQSAFGSLSLDSYPRIMLEPSQIWRHGLPERSNLVSPLAEAGGVFLRANYCRETASRSVLDLDLGVRLNENREEEWCIHE